MIGIKVTRNIRAIKTEDRTTPIEYPESGVLYIFNVETWEQKTSFYDKIAFSFGVPSTQKQVFCDFLNCKVMHYERTCQGVYFCPLSSENTTNTPCTVKPCRFRFHTCEIHHVQLKKSSACKLKLHFYVPIEKEDHRRILLCLGSHNHAPLNSKDIVETHFAPIKQPTLTEKEKFKIVPPKIEYEQEEKPKQQPPLFSPIFTLDSPKGIQTNSVSPGVSPRDILNTNTKNDLQLLNSNSLKDLFNPSLRDHNLQKDGNEAFFLPSPRENLFTPSPRDLMTKISPRTSPRNSVLSPPQREPSPISIDRFSPSLLSPRVNVGLPLTKTSPRENSVFENFPDRKRKFNDVYEEHRHLKNGLNELSIKTIDRIEDDPDIIKIALPPISSFDYQEKRKSKRKE